MRIDVKLTDGAPMPRHARHGDAGMDLTSRQTVTIAPGETVKVGTGVWMAIPEGCYGAVVPRSGVATKRGITIANAPGTIDSNYRGEIMLPLHNMNPTHVLQVVNGAARLVPNWDGLVTVRRGERVAQIIVQRHETIDCAEVVELSETERGSSGFGSTGIM